MMTAGACVFLSLLSLNPCVFVLILIHCSVGSPKGQATADSPPIRCRNEKSNLPKSIDPKPLNSKSRKFKEPKQEEIPFPVQITFDTAKSIKWRRKE